MAGGRGIPCKHLSTGLLPARQHPQLTLDNMGLSKVSAAREIVDRERERDAKNLQEFFLARENSIT
jgi:hypothetical protein